MKQIELNKNWRFKLLTTKHAPFDICDWMPATVPGTVHTDLYKNKVINDPFYGCNENNIQWIAECDWLYETKFDLPTGFDPSQKTELVFHGIDTIADIILNGQKSGSAHNMFLKYRIDISKFIKEKNNLLSVILKSPLKYARRLERKFGKLPVALNSSRVYIRKAQYSFGWDWGPQFPTSGIWKRVHLIQLQNDTIENIRFITRRISKKSADVTISFEVIKNNGDAAYYEVVLYDSSYSLMRKAKLKKHKNIKIDINVENPRLWWPHTHGKPHLYDLKIILYNKNRIIIDEKLLKVGIRKIQIVRKQKKRNTFYFKINGTFLYIKGANWIPADSFLPEVKKEKYQRLLKFAYESNMNMIRVWGGGIYENDYFYQLCDKFGILIWQDFMFACAAYPDHKAFIKNVKKEIKYVTSFLQPHPSIAIWCGNNENEWLWYQYNILPLSEMPGFSIFHDIIPEIIKKTDSSALYWPSSPFGYNKDPNDNKSGNRHEWGIWSGWNDYDNVTEDKSLFVTEFGFQAPANRYTIEKILTPANYNIQDEVFEYHNKQIEGPERIIKFLFTHLPASLAWKDYFYLTQLSQALALKSCLEHWRINNITQGSIIWQLNDCWPVSSWSLIDSENLPKMSYFFVKNAFAPVMVVLKNENDILQAIVSNHKTAKFEGVLRLYTCSIEEGIIIKNTDINVNISTGSQKSIILDIDRKKLIIADLMDKNSKIVHRNFYSSLKWKYCKSKAAEFGIQINKKDSTIVNIKAKNIVLFIDMVLPGYFPDDRGFIMLPGETRKIVFQSYQKRKPDPEQIEIFSLSQFLG